MSITFTSGTDAGSGIATRRLQRATAPLSGATCGTCGTFANSCGQPASLYTDSSLAVACYKYRYVVTDQVGNQDVATSASVVKVGYGGGVGATAGLLSHGGSVRRAVRDSTDTFTGTTGRC